ncbi:uncharacterized protein K452DRAFT_287144 [Aplosporella prunicola CBS 121167]|uniref:Mannose-1-phosphate guanyltransferase n=1 Tax=Aplosporella prunicola CBS 121167 TaxID=1176127 RepID=A0A6A6BF77_9PEZI|nr:uncharacterized protein K452DRAFT_287144 [Aplosporella prunicola CBS 121167]KAF2141955.1 hypothetical protein K452DRAFT_287144 [Aplosporella prunicola CBS 121167]
MPSPGFQALILCGPGVSLDTFTSSPKDFPKALVPIANRPMVWYPLEWCYRMGITNITLITPPESADALEAALSQNPHLTSLPSPKPDILAPADLTQTTGTGDLLRLPAVANTITGDFVVLPCDLICELDGASLLESWMVEQAGLGEATGGPDNKETLHLSTGGEKIGRRGGLGVWYPTKGADAVKGEETDFIATTPLPAPVVAPPPGSLRPALANLVYSIPTDVMKDITEENRHFPIRHSLLRKHARVRMLTTHRDAHIYFFPYWTLDMLKKNEKFDSISDALGWWAKAGWQDGLGEKLALREVLQPDDDSAGDDTMMMQSGMLNDEVDIASLSSTAVTRPAPGSADALKAFATRVRDASDPAIALAVTAAEPALTVPPIHAYVHPSVGAQPLVRRVDTAALLLNISLRLAKLPSVEEVGKSAASPFAHPAKIAHPEAVPKRCRVEAENSLVAENVSIAEKCNVKECVIGANCTIGVGARLQRCLLMEGAEVGENCQLTGCVLGRRCRIEGGAAKGDERTVLKDCEVQEGHVVEWGKEWKDEKFKRFGGLADDDDDDDGGPDAFGGDSGDDADADLLQPEHAGDSMR